jgi:hypothetical protein
MMAQVRDEERRGSLYAEVTARVIGELEQGRLPWVQPWDGAACGCMMPQNGLTKRSYSGINVLILWTAVIERGYSSQRWLTFRQALQLGGHVRKGEKGTVVCYADRFTPKGEAERARDEDRDARQIAFLKRFTVFNVDQCDGLPEEIMAAPVLPEERETIPHAEALIAATGADFRIGGGSAFYAPGADFVQVPPQQAYASRSTGIARRSTSSATGRVIRAGWRGICPEASGAAPTRVEELVRRWRAPSLRFASIQPRCGMPDYIGAGSWCCARTSAPLPRASLARQGGRLSARFAAEQRRPRDDALSTEPQGGGSGWRRSCAHAALTREIFIATGSHALREIARRTGLTSAGRAHIARA